jgi:hypothetical protein
VTRRTITDLSAVLDRAAAVRTGMFRLEVLQAYDVRYEEAAYRAYLHHGRVDLTPGPWQELVTRHTAAGRSCRRVHVVHEPLTPYLCYEIAAPYTRSAAAGEQIRLLVTPVDHWPDPIPRTDFWIFDDEVWGMRYDDAGRLVAIQTDDNPDVVTGHCRAAEAAFAAAIPLEVYLQQVPW